MLFGLLADALVMVHLAFVAFVVAGGLLVFRHPLVRWVHLPAATWGALIEITGWICPLTPWELALRSKAGEAGYPGGFVEHYLLPVLYPERLTPGVQILLGGLVIAINLAIYVTAWRRRAGARRPEGGPPA